EDKARAFEMSASAERIRVRAGLINAEEQLRLLQRRQADQQERARARVEEAEQRLRQVTGGSARPAPRARKLADLERRLAEPRPEGDELPRERNRSASGKGGSKEP